MQKGAYTGRARLVRAHAAPGRWLDVGTGLPWLPRLPTLRRRLARRCVWTGIIPLLPLTLSLDAAILAGVRLTDGGNVYRLLARKHD